MRRSRPSGRSALGALRVPWRPWCLPTPLHLQDRSHRCCPYHPCLPWGPEAQLDPEARERPARPSRRWAPEDRRGPERRLRRSHPCRPGHPCHLFLRTRLECLAAPAGPAGPAALEFPAAPGCLSGRPDLEGRPDRMHLRRRPGLARPGAPGRPGHLADRQSKRSWARRRGPRYPRSRPPPRPRGRKWLPTNFSRRPSDQRRPSNRWPLPRRSCRLRRSAP